MCSPFFIFIDQPHHIQCSIATTIKSRIIFYREKSFAPLQIP
jgi:hypothetical protein